MAETKNNSTPNKALILVIGMLTIIILILLGWKITKVNFFGIVELVPPATTTSFSSSSSSIKLNISVPASSGWVSTGLFLSDGQNISITANGLVDYNGQDSNAGESDPDGDGTSCDKASIESLINQKLDIDCMMSGVSWGMLIGKIENNPPFVIGSNYKFTANASGELYLGINDCCSLEDNTGEFKVIISAP